MAKGLVVEPGEISQEIDLSELTGVDIGRDPVLRRAIAQATIDYMVDRVQKENLGLGRKPWSADKYSESYSKSLAFKAAGKSKGDVNLTLSGDMLSLIDLVEERGSRIKIAVDPGQIDRAYGAQTGYKGHPVIPEGVYKREFFGVTEKEMSENVLPRFSTYVDALRNVPSPSPNQDIQGQLIEQVRNLADFFDFET
jgi:hypothetical protein